MVVNKDAFPPPADALQAAGSTAQMAQLVKSCMEAIGALAQSNQAIIGKIGALEAKMQGMQPDALHLQFHTMKHTLGTLSRKVPFPAGRPIRCVFLVHAVETWHAMAGIYEAMRAAEDFEPIVITTHSKVTRTVDFVGEDNNHAVLEAAGTPHLRFSGPDSYGYLDILKALAPDIIFRQMPWEPLLPPAFNVTELSSFARVCYVPYGYLTVKRFQPNESEASSASKKHTDEYFHRMCWRIFCETEMHKTMYEKYAVRAGDNVVVTGYPKFDSLLEAKKKPPYWPVQQKGKKRFRVIWAPHHSVTADWIGLGTFLETHNDMYGWALKAPNEYEFVLKPHPALYGELVKVKRVMSQDYLDSYLKAWNALPNTAIMDTGDYGPLFAASDAMVTDGVSFFSEYQVFEKPLIFMDSGRHMGFNEAGSVVMESANPVKNVAGAIAFCERLRAGKPDPMRQKQKEVLKRIMPYPGQSAQKVLEAIRTGWKQDYGTA
jgi:hypothetical protein